MSTFNVSYTAFLHSSVVYQPVDFMSGAGGCMHLNTTAAASFAHCRFAHCSSTLTGGGVSFFQGEVKPQFHNTTFEFNEALIQVGEVKPQFHNTTFEFNEALIQGGGIELVMMSGQANFTDCTFRSNRVTNGPSFGAAILSFGVPMRVERSYFWRNVAINMLPPGSQATTYLTQGGAIAANMFMDATVPYDIIDCTFVENQRSYFWRNVAVNSLPPGSQAATYLTQGGAIAANMFMDASVPYDIIDCTFIENQGAVLSFGVPMRVERSYVAINTLPPGSQAATYLSQGGAIAANMFMDATVPYDIIDCTFVENQGGQGGALYMDTGHLQVLNCLLLLFALPFVFTLLPLFLYCFPLHAGQARRGIVCGHGASASFQLPLSIPSPPLCFPVPAAMQGGQGGALYADTGHLQVLNCLFLRNGDHSECSLGGASESHSPASVLLVRGPGDAGVVLVSYSPCGLLVLSEGLVTHHPTPLSLPAVTSRAQTVIDNCTFVDNKAQDQGGALHFLPYKTLNVSRSRFQGNSVLKQNGGAIYVLGVSWELVGHGGGEGGEQHIREKQGRAIQGTGAVRVESGGGAGREQHIRGQQGGEVQGRRPGTGAVRVESSTFVGNRAGQSKGGALYSESVSVTFDNVTLDGNTAALQGGAVAVYASCRFVCNEAVLGGGAIYTWFVLCLSPFPSPPPPCSLCRFDSDGLPTEALFKSCRFVRNEAVLGGGAIYTGLGMHTRVHACEVEENNSTGLGGAVLVQEFSRVEMTRTRCQGNMTPARGEQRVSAAARTSPSSPPPSPTTPRPGAVPSGWAALCYALTDSQPSPVFLLCFPPLLPPLFLPLEHPNHSALTGGACLSLLANAHATVTDSVLSANHGTSEGGAARVSGSAHLSILSSSILHNTAAWGGAVWVEMGASLLISNNSRLEGNEARYLGGTVYATHVSRVEVRGGSVFRGNSALHGGAMVVEAEARVTAADSAFDNNTFSGILFQGFSQGVLQNCSFTGNSNAAGRGGAVLVGDKTTVAVHSCRFSGNWAALGGAVSTEGSPYLTINGSDFTRNIAQIGAGVALAGATAFTMGESVFIKNNATKAGGGVAVLEQVEGEISGSRFEGNYAVVGGAGVYLMRSAAATTAAAVGGDRPPQAGASASASGRGLLFDGNSAMDAHGVAFFDASYSPHLRSACHACQMRQQGDTQGSMPADFYLKSCSKGTRRPPWVLLTCHLPLSDGHPSPPLSPSFLLPSFLFTRYCPTPLPPCHPFSRWPGAAASSQETGGSFSVVGSVGSMLTGLQVVVVDEFGNIVSKDNSALASVSPDSRISGSLRGTSQGGIITVPPIAVRVSPGGALQPIALTVTVSSTTNAFPDFSHPFNISFCPAGQYFDGESFSCQDCPVGHWCAPGQGMETCPDGTFTFYPNAVSQDECTPCDDDSLDCRYGTLEIQYQNWLDPASLNSTPTTYACLLTNGCSSTTYTGPNTTQCAVGYSNTMPMCSSCADGYYLVLQFCEQCTSALKSVFPLLLIIVLAVWVAMNMLADTFAAMDIFLIEVQLLAMVASFNLNFPASWVKTVVLLYNIAAFDPDIIRPECAFSLQFTGKFYATILLTSHIPSASPLSPPFPPSNRTSSGQSAPSHCSSWENSMPPFERRPKNPLPFPPHSSPHPPWQDIIGPECAFSMQFTGKFYATLLIPVLGLLVYALVFAHHRWLGGSFFVRVHSWQRKERQRQRLALQRSVTKRRAYNEYENSIVHASLKWLDICYVSVMVKVLQVFKSQEIGTSTVMAAAPQILWLSSAHVGMLVTAVLVTVVYLVGLPLLFAGVLVDAHTCDVLSSTLFKQRFGWLTERFRPKFWW
ncbi:unnamed protein product [Closterium sp. Naga37s-1]|nr:unnamed protein product [Closterium sp. Naga37s-1]